MEKCLTLLATTMLAAVQVFANDEADSKTVIGPSNLYLYDGANALVAGDAEKGVPLTVKGLELAHGQREEKFAHANLCAGYVLLGQPQVALEHCNWVLDLDPYHWRTYNNRAIAYLRLERFADSEADIRKGQALKPGSEKLKEVMGMYLDEVNPVAEKITMDERRNEPRSPTTESD